MWRSQRPRRARGRTGGLLETRLLAISQQQLFSQRHTPRKQRLLHHRLLPRASTRLPHTALRSRHQALTQSSARGRSACRPTRALLLLGARTPPLPMSRPHTQARAQARAQRSRRLRRHLRMRSLVCHCPPALACRRASCSRPCRTRKSCTRARPRKTSLHRALNMVVLDVPPKVRRLDCLR